MKKRIQQMLGGEELPKMPSESEAVDPNSVDEIMERLQLAGVVPVKANKSWFLGQFFQDEQGNWVPRHQRVSRRIIAMVREMTRPEEDDAPSGSDS